MEQDKAFGVMFHHFHDDKHPEGQGSISRTTFSKIIDFMSKEFRIIHAANFTNKVEMGTLGKNEICLTFDDSLLSQFDVALPVLEAKGISSIFNVYTSTLTGTPSPLEIFRYFRTTCFDNLEDFYGKFDLKLSEYVTISEKAQIASIDETNYLEAYPFYSRLDRKFRFARDKILGSAKYQELMDGLMADYNFNVDEVPSKVFMDTTQIAEIVKRGHMVGLHSHTHPTQIHTLSQEEQSREYSENSKFLTEITGTKPRVMAHPCGNYNEFTLKILDSMGIVAGFRSDNKTGVNKPHLEIAREDHANIVGRLT